MENGQNFYPDGFWILRPPHWSEISTTSKFCLFGVMSHLAVDRKTNFFLSQIKEAGGSFPKKGKNFKVAGISVDRVVKGSKNQSGKSFEHFPPTTNMKRILTLNQKNKIIMTI